MKSRLLRLFVCLSFTSRLYAQDALDTITQNTCACLRQTDSNISDDEYKKRLVFCIFNDIGVYRDEIKSKYNIDVSQTNDFTQGVMSKLIVPKMPCTCPDQFNILMTIFGDEKTNSGNAISGITDSVTGPIVQVDTSKLFITLVLKDAKGWDEDFLWLTPFEGDKILMKELTGLKGKTVSIFFSEEQVYLNAYKNYMKYKIIKGLHIQ